MAGRTQQLIRAPLLFFAGLERVQRLGKQGIVYGGAVLAQCGAQGQRNHRIQVGKAHARGAGSHAAQGAVAQRQGGVLVPCALQELEPLTLGGKLHQNRPVKAANQGAVQRVGAAVHAEVGGSDDEHRLGVVTAEAVHLGEKGVQHLLAGVLGVVAGTGAGNGVDLVNEQDRRGIATGRLEQLVHGLRAFAHVLLKKLAALSREKRHAGFPGHGLGQHGFAGARRAVQQQALGIAQAGGAVFAGVAQVIGEEPKFFFGIGRADHVRKAHIRAGNIAEQLLGVLRLHRALAPQTEQLDVGGLAICFQRLGGFKGDDLIAAGQLVHAELALGVEVRRVQNGGQACPGGGEHLAAAPAGKGKAFLLADAGIRRLQQVQRYLREALMHLIEEGECGRVHVLQI